MKKKSLLITLGSFLFMNAFAQVSPDYSGGIKVKFDEEGKKYLRIISWVQGQASYNLDNESSDPSSPVGLNVRRARVLMFSKINDKFMVLTHFGLNSLNSNSLSPTGKGNGSQLFFHDAWAEYKLHEDHSMGMGLHYFNGISRASNQSTLNMLTLDNNRQSWATLGMTDQFARHVGVFFKGKFGKLQYRLAINDALTNTLETNSVNSLDDLSIGQTAYVGKKLLGSKEAGFAYAGYFEYQLWDQESNFVPFKVGTYLGKKKILNIGAGFFLHPNGSVNRVDSNTFEGQNVSLLAADIFMETPIGENGAALTAYAVLQTNNYGKNYMLGTTYGTGTMIYTHVGYLLPGDMNKGRWQPYISFQNHSYDAHGDNQNRLGIGTNYYISGNNAKLSIEYTNRSGISEGNMLTLQAMIYL